MMMGGPRGRMMATQPPGEKRPIRAATVRRVAEFFRPYRWQVALTVVAIALVAIIGLVNPLLSECVSRGHLSVGRDLADAQMVVFQNFVAALLLDLVVAHARAPPDE